jgi:hypothetical protein
LPYPSTLLAVWEYRFQELLEEAARERLAISAVQSHRRQEEIMFGDGQDSIVQRGIDEALACRDMLTRAPVAPSRLARIVAHLVGLGQSFARRLPRARPRRAPVVTHGTVTH